MNILVTGAASGIGLATAHLLHSRGHTVILWDIDSEKLEPVAQLLDVQFSCVDVTNYEQVTSATQSVITNFQTIDAVIHCAGIAHVGLFDQISIEQHQQTISVNFVGTVNVAHATIPYLKTSHGSLILIASSSSFYGSPDFATYSATKAAIIRFAEAIRLELEENNVHVGVISPHFVQTPMLEESKKSAMYDGVSFATSAEDIALHIDKMLRLRRDVSVPKLMNKLNYFLARHFPELAPSIVRSIWQRGKKRRRN